MGGSSVSAPTIDTDPAIEAFQMAADVIEKRFPYALQMYTSSLNAGTRAQLDQNLKAETLNIPFSTTATDAISEMRQFMGMAPLSKVEPIIARLNNTISKLQTPAINPSFDATNLQNVLKGYVSDLKQLDASGDPASRQQLKSLISQNLNNFASGLNYDVKQAMNTSQAFGLYSTSTGTIVNHVNQKDLTAEQMKKYGLDGLPKDISYSVGPKGEIVKFNMPVAPDKVLGFDGKSPSTVLQSRGANRKYIEVGSLIPQSIEESMYEVGDRPSMAGVTGLAYGAQNKAFTWEQLGDAQNIVKDVMGDLSSITEELQVVPDAPGKAFTGQEITERLTQLPEYQFQLQQGTQAMERSQAARGELQSGRALIEGQQFGQNLAQNTYQQHIAQLSNLAGLNMPVVTQQANQFNMQGANASQSNQQLGGFAAQTIQDIARSRESAFVRQGQTLYDAAKTNAQMQMQANMANAQSSGQAMAGIGQIAGKLLGGLF